MSAAAMVGATHRRGVPDLRRVARLAGRGRPVPEPVALQRVQEGACGEAPGARQVHRGTRGGMINSTSLNALGLSGSTFTVAYSTPWMPLTANPPVAVLARVAWNSGRS